MPNTPPPPPIPNRPSDELVEDLCLALRHVAIGDYDLLDEPPRSERTKAYITEVKHIYAELERRHVDVGDRITLLSTETTWQMDALLRDCLNYPKVIPYVRERDGIRRALRCPLCRQQEMPQHKEIRLCDICLATAKECVESTVPVNGLVLFRTYNPSKWCEHANAETVLVSLDGSEWIEVGNCRICLAEEQQRRKNQVEPEYASTQNSEAAWEQLPDSVEQAVWTRFYLAFDFHASIDSNDWPGIKEPQPSLTYDISLFYDVMSNPRTLEKDLNTKTLKALKQCVGPEQRLYALDWQHPCYWFYPLRQSDAGNMRAWSVPILPNGDYYIFLAEDFSFGLFGHPWEQTICVFGQVLLDAFAEDMPAIFSKPIRKNIRKDRA